MASLSTCHLGLWLGWQILLNLVKSIDADPVSHPDDMPSTAAVEPVERPDEAHDSGKRVRFSTPEAGYQTRSGRLSKPPAKFNL